VRPPTPRTRGTAFATAAAVAALGAATAFAAGPKAGYHYENEDVGNGTTVNVISLSVDEDATVTAASGTDPKCRDESGLYEGFSITKPIDASNGKFEFDGKAASLLPDGPAKVKVHLKGKFTSSKHSKGSYTLEGCDGKTKFKTDWSLGG
jgi:hypothetical protein